MPRAAEPRRAVPMRLQRDKALELAASLMRKLGLVPVDAEVAFELDHDPALCLRPVDPANGQHIPHQHDPSCLIWRTKEAHARKTRGTGATTAGSDVGEDRKTRQLVKARVERGEVKADDPSIAPWAPNTNTRPAPKQVIRSAGFPRRDDKPSSCRTPDKLAHLPRRYPDGAR